MDYSLLLKIERGSEADGKNQCTNHERVYHLGVIDYLQEWNFNKMGERFLKTRIKGMDGQQLSALKPAEYSQRYLDYMNKYIFKWEQRSVSRVTLNNHLHLDLESL